MKLNIPDDVDGELPINRNMRCIEMDLGEDDDNFSDEINRNMRCIEIYS